jgi:hypothetical protein
MPWGIATVEFRHGYLFPEPERPQFADLPNMKLSLSSIKLLSTSGAFNLYVLDFKTYASKPIQYYRLRVFKLPHLGTLSPHLLFVARYGLTKVAAFQPSQLHRIVQKAHNSLPIRELIHFKA